MIVKPKDNRLVLQGKASIELTTRQRWDAKESKIPGIIKLARQNIKLSLSTEEFNSYFSEVKV